MTQDSKPWNGVTVGDAGPYTDQHWHELYRYIIGLGGNRDNVGVFLGSGSQPNDGLRVVQQGPAAAAVNVLEGAALVHGIAYFSDAIESFPVAVNASGNPRVDTIILQADYALQEARLDILTGTPAASPVPPSLTQNAGVLWEIPIADIAVSSGFTTIVQANITPRHEYVNAPPGVYLDHVLNNAGSALQDGQVVVWDNTSFQAVTITTTLDDKALAGVVRGRIENGAYGRIQTQGLGYVNANAAVTVGNILVSSATARLAAISAGANNCIIGRALETTSGAGFVLCNIAVHTVRDEEYILIRDEKTTNTAAASLTLGGWRQRELNTEVFDTGGFAAVAANQVTLQPGVYEIHAGAPVDAGRISRARWQNITAGATTVEGSNIFSGHASVFGQFTITVATVFQLQHYVNATSAGGPTLNTGETEKYAWVYLVRKAETP
jgi:hypothetical protein